MVRNCRRRCTRKREVLSESRMREICMSGSMSGCGNGAMAEPLRHRQTKEAATDMFYLKPPRHISTLPKGDIGGRMGGVCFTPKNGHPATTAACPLCARSGH